MSEGRIYYATRRGNYYLKLVGDVRVTLCTALSNYVDRLFEADLLKSVVVDLRDARVVDSTTLGFLAKVALHSELSGIKPLLIITDSSMIRLIEGMGFDEIFQITDDFSKTTSDLEEMKFCSGSSDVTREKVIESHRILMSMNSKNMKTFSSLVKALERESEAQ